MKFAYQNKKISGILTVIPKNFKTFDEEMQNYHADENRVKRLKMVMGYEKHHLVEDGVTVSDLVVFGMEYLFEKKLLGKDEISALILVTESPDYFLPPTSNVIHGRLKLSKDVLCMDINQGCAGYILGLMQGCTLLNNIDMKKVVMINADILSRKVSREDKSSYPIYGDAVSISILENVANDEKIFGEIKMDGTRADVLIIPAGGFKLPSSPETAVMHEDENGNRRALDHMFMRGQDVFYFVQTEVPPLINGLLNRIGMKKSDIDYFLFHQPNKFMVEKLAEAIGVEYEKCPSNIVANFGNSSGVTIPMNIVYNLGERLLDEKILVCMSGFGVGLSWGAIVMNIGNFEFCRMIEF